MVTLAGLGVKGDIVLLLQATDIYKLMGMDESVWCKEIDRNKKNEIINEENNKETIQEFLLRSGNDEKKVQQILAQTATD